MLEYQLNTNNWNSIGNIEVLAAQEPNNGRLLPIVFQELASQTSSPLLAVSITTPGARVTWNWAGYLLQVLDTHVSIVGASSQGVLSSHRLYLNQVNLIELFHPTGSSAIRFIIPKYFVGWKCLVWEYVGVANDNLTNKLNAIHSDLTTLQHEFDAYTGM